ncbi:hypothetical protein GE107_25470 [Cohnella sp. CFH 77786]|uniref:hypothetical protein n=1 Tax=Cohnella sp. CFH 77786 TaxID=2662265 RepID=UPI001C610C7D|nr:hypothetical protein [Cohnella sp. CFH 77786]MBW5449381.1 hypothetical protein [Cohnella sp. CFH 77786]
MSEAVLRDLKMTGTTTTAGGRYNLVRITGECTVTGDLASNRLSVTGNMTVQGALKGDQLKLTGECAIGGTMHAGKVQGRGELRIAGGARAENVALTGNVSVGGDFEAGRFDLAGAFQIDGLLSADRLDVRLLGPSHAREIGGEILIVRRSRALKLLNLVHASSAAGLKADVIEGDALDLSYTNAKIVRGNNVVLGPGCRVDTVEYRTSLEVHKSAVVLERVRI